MSAYHFQPVKGQARQIVRTILESPEIASCQPKEASLIRLACEEIVVNVALYAYPEADGSQGSEDFLDVDIRRGDDRITICFEDGGIPFNPLEHKEPDLELSLELRDIGGLGIFLVIKKMDEVRYAYVDGKNVLTIEKVIS